MRFPHLCVDNKPSLNDHPLSFFLNVIIVMILVLLPARVQAESKHHDGLQDAEAQVCFKCHKKLAEPTEGGSVHEALSMGCSACHELADGGKFRIMDTGDVLCYMCHDAKNTKAAVHGPVASGDCVMCHNPHQSPHPKLLLDSPLSKLCFNCHDEAMSKLQHVHAPVAEGECTSCHDPHESPYSKQLIEDGNTLCLMCHMDVEEAIDKKKHVHDAIEMAGCTGCHSPHSAVNKFQLLKKPPELCLECHDDKGEEVKTPHGALTAKKSCLNCHDPHASNFAQQLKSENMELCLSCHNRRRKTSTGFIMNMKKFLKGYPEHHGPILSEECSPCHNPHGSNEWRMLRKSFPSTFYTPFKVEAYALCFECHDQELVLDKSTASATGFRNGEINLHYIHVNDPSKGRRCAVCHDVHATKGPRHIRETVLFGKWNIPINFNVDEEGGRCATGCHVPRAYNRTTPVKNR